MAAFCIPPILAEKLKAAAVRGEIDIEKMYEMTSEERKTLFENYVDPVTAKAINVGFEKAMVSEKVDALSKWADKTFVGERAAKKKTVIDKIKQLSEAGLLTPQKEEAFYQDLVAEKLGLTVTTEEAQKIYEMSGELQKLQGQESEFGTESLDYFKARRKMQDYIDSLQPSSPLKVLTSIIGRGNMLARVSSPFLNIESNTVMGAVQAFSRRLEARRVGGVNNSYALEYQKFALNVYMKTGYDITRMISVNDDLTVRGEDMVTSQGKGAIRKVGRIYEDVIFKGMQGTPDIVYAGFAAADRANIESTKIARSEGLTGSKMKARALEIFKDSTRIEPNTKEGIEVRDKAVADAMYTTYTNKSVYADVSLGIRKVLNLASGDLRFGDQLMPFVKTPANVIGSGLNMSGIGLPVDATYRLFKVMGDMKRGDTFTEAVQDEFAGFWRTMVQAGLGLTIAHLISSMFEPEDFVGEYPTTEKERQLLALKNAPTNSVRIGDRWISMDYFGPIGPAITGMMYAKKYGKDLPTSSYQYLKGTLKQAAKLPGFEDAAKVYEYLDSLDNDPEKTISDEMRDVAAYAIGFAQSRLTPGILYDLSKMTDTSERTNPKGDLFARVKSSIPGLRQELPEKKIITGETVSTESPLSILLFGSRVKTANQSATIDEFTRLDETGNLPSITDVEKTSTRVKAFKDQVPPEKYNKAMTEFKTEFGRKTIKLIQTSTYKRKDDAGKAELINKEKDELLEKTLKKYGYKQPKKK